MFCGKCGAKVDDDALFCPECGAKIEKDIRYHGTKPQKNNSEKEPKKSFVVPIIIAIAVIVVIVAAVFGYLTVGLNMQEKKLSQRIEDSNIQACIELKDQLQEEWDNLGMTDFSAKKSIIKDLKDIEKTIKTASSTAKESKESKAPSKNEMKEPETETKAPVKNSVPLNVTVQQVDASAFPKVKLYLNIKDTNTGTVPSNLKNNFFYISKQDANAQYVKGVVSEVNQLNGKEALKVNMVADVSGSMSGSPLMDAKNVMSTFIQSVQFNAGDQVELTSFATGVQLVRPFSSDANVLINDVNNLNTGDMTSLYDALYTAVGRVAAQNGAKCVIAFTDGNDNYSSCSADDVIALANRYHIPVFIIGIGNIDYYDMERIASQTNGSYYSIYDVISMQDIYNEIYRMEKELYLLEFEDTTGAAITDTANIKVGYKSSEYEGECVYTYVPNTLVSVDSQTMYTDGPEAVVERYMKGFDDAMTYMDFSFIADTMLPGSNIYNGQQSYIQQGIMERLDAYEIVSTVYSDANNCVITTRETYTIQKPNRPLELMTQQAQYAVTNTQNGWKIHDFAGEVQVLSRINQ